MTVTDETLSAYIDDELSPDEMEAIKTAIVMDNELAARLENMKCPDRLITEAFGGIDSEPLPEAILDLLEDDDANSPEDVIPFPAMQAVRPAAPWVAPLAASVALAVGIVAGMQIAPDRSDSREQVSLAGVINASNPLYAALESAQSTSRVETSEGAITPILTFKSVDGPYCREFFVERNAYPSRAVACRLDGAWVVQFAALAAEQTQQATGYSTASAEITAQFDILVENMIAGDALDTEQERELVGNW